MLSFRAFVAAVFALVGVAAVAPAAAETKLRISLQYPSSDIMVTHMRNFADKVAERTNGEVTSDIYTDFTLFKQGQELAAIQRGNLDIALLNTGDVEQQIPEYSILSSGYLFRDYEHLRATFNGEIGEEFADRMMRELGVKVLAVPYGGTRHMLLRDDREVASPADLEGVKLRMPGAPAWQVLGKGLGVTPTPMALGEIYLALRTGAIDGQENPLGIIRALKMEEVAKQLILTAHMIQPGVFVMSADTWNSLTDEQREIVADAAREAIEEQDAARLEMEKADLVYLREYGLKISEPDREPFRASVRAAFEESGIAATWPEGLADRIAAVQ